MTLIKKQRNEFPVFGDMMTDLFEDTFFKPQRTERRTPLVNILDEATGFKVQFAAPGMNKENFSIDLNENILTVKGENKAEKEEKGKFTLKEFNYAAFQRSFKLPKTVDKENIKANYFDGILEVSIPKLEPAKPVVKQITIE